MTDNRNGIVAVAILITLVGVLLSCCMGAVGGMLAGSLQVDRMTRRLERMSQAGSERTAPAADLPERADDLMPGTTGPSAAPDGWDESSYAGGALVLQVRTDGPALASGLQRNDVIVFVDNTAVTLGKSLAELIAEHQPGDRVTIRYWRAGEERETSVQLGKSPSDPRRAYLGVTTIPAPARPTPKTPGAD